MQQPPNGYGTYGAPPPGYGPPPNQGGYGYPPPYGQPMGYVALPFLAPKCSRTAYVLLGLFLGAFGIHNFVAGRVGSGVAQLLITLLTGWLLFPLGIVWLWIIIELIAVDRDGNGTKMS